VDVLLDDAARESAIGTTVRRLFDSWGYDEAIPPTYERIETLLAGGIRPDWMVRFADPGGNALALRPDFTTQIARIVATRLRDQPKPLRLFYVGSVVRRPKPSTGRRAEFAQAGIELVGSREADADAEVVAVAIDALTRLGIDDVQIHLGQSAFFRGLVDSASLSETDVAELHALLDRRDREALARRVADLGLSECVGERILGCLELCGGPEILDRAEAVTNCRAAEAALRNLSDVYTAICDHGHEDRVVLDLAEARGLGYYTGLMIEGFSRSLPAPILEGGRYDNLIEQFGDPCPAVGCALDVPRIASVLASANSCTSRVDVLVRFEPAARRRAIDVAASLRAEGRRVELEVTDRTDEETAAYARDRGIAELRFVGTDRMRIFDVGSGAVLGGRPWND
jgi:ATP phosphoribosyltransferase regulatory subunit